MAIADEIAAADDLRRVLDAADERDGIECRVDTATQHPFVADGRGQGVERDRGPDPRQGTADALRETNLAEAGRVLNAHTDEESN